MHAGRVGSDGPVPGSPGASPIPSAAHATRPDPTVPDPRPAPPPGVGSPSPPPGAPTRAPQAPETPPFDRSPAARDTVARRTVVPGRCSSGVDRPHRSKQTDPASSSGSPSGSALMPHSSSRPTRCAAPSPPAGPDTAPAPLCPTGPSRYRGSPRPGRPRRTPPPPAPTTPPSPTGHLGATTVTALTPPVAPFFLDAIEALDHDHQAALQYQPRGRQRRASVVRQGAAHRGAVASDRHRLRVVTSLDLSLDGPDPTDALLQLL